MNYFFFRYTKNLFKDFCGTLKIPTDTWSVFACRNVDKNDMKTVLAKTSWRELIMYIFNHLRNIANNTIILKKVGSMATLNLGYFSTKINSQRSVYFLHSMRFKWHKIS